MSAITTHVLDTVAGKPASGIHTELSILSGGDWQVLGQGTTDADGRAPSLLPETYALTPGLYRLRFATKAISEFFPEVTICFQVQGPGRHYHVPLLLSTYGYTTYRGS